ncbi:MAG: transporter substrate-binding domain-containing protein, partial [Hungatella sp.]
MKKAVFGMMLAGCMMASLVGCSTKNTNSAGTTAETKAADTKAADTKAADTKAAETAAAGGTFTVGFDQDFPPMGFLDDKGEYTGFDLELAREVAKRLGLEFVPQPIAGD